MTPRLALRLVAVGAVAWLATHAVVGCVDERRLGGHDVALCSEGYMWEDVLVKATCNPPGVVVSRAGSKLCVCPGSPLLVDGGSE